MNPYAKGDGTESDSKELADNLFTVGMKDFYMQLILNLFKYFTFMNEVRMEMFKLIMSILSFFP